MKKKFTILITAAFMLLTMMARPVTVWGQTRTEGDTHEFSQTLQQLLNDNASIPSIEIEEQEYPVKTVTISYRYNKTITNAVTMEVLVGGTSWGTQYSTGTGSNYTTIDFEGASTTGPIVINFTNNTGNGTGHGTFYVNKVTLTEGSAGGGSDPEIHFNGQSANIGTNNPVGTEVSTSFTVYQSNLTEDITFDIEGVGSLDPGSIVQGANPTEVTWSYTPTVAGSFNTTITATSGTVSATYSIYGEAKAIHNVNIAAMTNGSVTASPSSGIQGTNIDLTITPDAGYALSSLTVVDGDNNELTVTNNRFQMPDSDVTVSATFEESSAVTVVDYLDREFTGIADGATSYSSWTGKTGASGAVYAGNSAGSNNSIQLRTNGSASGIVTTASAGKVTKVEVDWNSNTATGRKINVYGSNNAYTDASKLHNATTAGTLIGTIDFGSTTELAITDEYAYIGIRSTSGALYLNWVKISWSSEEVPAPSFTITNNNELAYDATEGSFNFTVNNPVDGGVTTVFEDVDWISDVAISGNSVTYNTTANEGVQREGTITLTYTYNTTETVSKDVTVTQAAAPVIYSTIPSLFAAATTTEANVHVTFNNWVVSGVSTNGKNIFITDNNGNGFVIYYTSDMSNTFAAGNVLSGTAVSCTLKLYNGFAELLNVDVADLTITDGGTVTETSIEMATLAGVNTGALLHYENLTCSVTGGKYYLSDGTTTLQVFNSLYAFEALENAKTYNITGVYQQYNTTKEILPRRADDIEEVVIIEPTITVQPATVSAPFTGAEGTLTVTYENITTIVAEVKFYEADGVTEATYDWIDADINSSNNVDYIIDANTGEARSAYLKVYALGDDSQDVYSNLVTINQAEYVAPTYAELPFEFKGGRADIEGTDGLYQEGLGSDYSSAPKLKFDSTDDWLLLQFSERPGTLTFDIKGNGFSDGTFTVQTSEDGVTYTDLETYTELGSTQHESFDNLGENVRYIKWIYTTKDAGNVGLGNIALAEYVAPVAAIILEEYAISAPADGTNGSMTVTLENMTISDVDNQFSIDFFHSDGSDFEPGEEKPDWVHAEFTLVNNVYSMNYTVDDNQLSTERNAYFKVYGLDDDGSTDAYSELVTVTQDGYVAPVAAIILEEYAISAPADGTDGSMTVTLENMTISDVDNQFSIDFFHSDGSDFEPGEEKPDWVHAEFTLVNNVYSMNYTVDDNQLSTERNAYFKVYGLDDDGTTEAYSNLVTVTQAGYVVDYAELPFEWEGGTRSAFEALNGTSTSGVGDYGDNQGVYRMKLDGTGDYIQVKTNEQPGVVTIGVKMIGGATSSTITVQGSADGDTFTDVEELTISGSQNDELTIETTNDFAATDRYVRLYFTKGSNVGVGPITIAQVDNTPSITLSSYEIEATAEETDGEITVTYKNIETDLGVEILWFETATSTDPISAAPEWIDADINSDMNVEYLIEANTGEARSAYFKVFAMGSTDFVYSNLVTINQAASAPQVATYELVESIDDLVPGVHYYIAGKNGNDWYAMGEQKSNNRAAVAVTVTNDVITETEDVYEFVISGDATNLYTIYDESAKSMGYLFAPAGTSSNYLRTQSTNTNNGEWTISINETTHVATIKANITNNKYMRYNYGSTVFSCYSSNTSQKDIYLYKKVGDSNPVYYSPTATTIENPDPTTDPIIVLNNEILTITGSVTCTPDDILIQDGGQLIHDTPINATIQRNVKGYDANRDASPSGYMLIASPVYAPINVTSTNLTTGEYDLYIFAESQPEKEWRNYKAGEFTTIENEKGYLYANKSNGTISFAGTLRSSINNVTVNLDYTDGNRFSGWNLVGNPFACNVYANDTTGKGLAFYKMNENGDGFEAVTNGSVAPMEGIFVHTDAKGKSFVFTRSIPEQSQGKGNLNIQIAQVVNNRDVQRVSDNAIIRFDGGNNLEKFSFSDNNDKLYFTLGNKDYSVLSAEARGEMPISFKAQTNGTYTISFDMDNVEFSYLHLIDNITGVDVDLLDNQTYTFEASKVDYASRFRLVFNAIGDSDSNSDVDNDFGFFDANGNLNILGIEGLATLQVIDVTGRVISNETFSGNYSKAINAKAGVYMLRLIQGNDVRTQKIVVK